MLFTIFLCAIMSCNKVKKKALEIKEEEIAAIVPRDSIQESIVVYNSAKTTLDTVTKSAPIIGKRGINTKKPPIKLSLDREDLEVKDIDLADYYSKVSYIKLSYPSESGTFLSNASIVDDGGDGRVNISNGVSSWVSLSNDLIIAGDNYFGFHVFDLSGKFMYTLAQPDKFPIYNKREQIWRLNKAKARLIGLSLFGDYALISTNEEGIFKMHFYNLKKRKGESTIIYSEEYNSHMLINLTEFVEYAPIYEFKEQKPIWKILYRKDGKSISEFSNYNPLLNSEDKIITNNTEYNASSYYNDILTLRQAFNDTIYRVKSPQELEAAYVLDMGDKKISIKDAAAAKTEEKLIFGYNWLETDKFMYVYCSLNRDSFNARKETNVKYRYFYYSKEDKKLYRLQSDVYPEDLFFKTNIADVLPIKAQNTQVSGKRLYTSYTKAGLGEVMKNKFFSDLPESQQQKTKEIYNSLKDNCLMVMILE